MVTSKENCEQFRRDLKSLNYYKSRLEEINLDLVELNTRMEGVSSPGVKDVIIENKDPYKSNFVELMMREDELIEQRKNITYMINQIESKLQLLPEDIKEVCVELYIKGRNAENVAIEYGFGHKKTMYRAINKEVDKNM